MSSARRTTRWLAWALGAASLALACWAARTRSSDHHVAPRIIGAPTSSPLAPASVGSKNTASPREREGQRAIPAAPLERDLQDTERTPALRSAFERQAPDATAPAEEARLRAIYGAERDADTILRDVRCTRSVCKLGLRWSPELHQPYNNALVRVIRELSREIDLNPDIPPSELTTPIPMTLYVARPGHSIETLLAEQAQLAR